MKKNSNTDFDILGILIEIWDEIDANKHIKDKAMGVEKTIVYAKALSKALEQNEPSLLIAMLSGENNEGVIPHPKFLPLIAEVIRRSQLGYKDGRKPKSTGLEKLFIYYDICRYHTFESKNLDEAYAKVADENMISEATAKAIRTEFIKKSNIPRFFQYS